MSVQSATLCRVTSLSGPRYWSVVGQFVDNEIKRRGWTDAVFALQAGLSRATIARLKSGEELGEASLARIEGALDLPRDLLTYIADQDLDEIVAAVGSVDPDLPRWLTKKYAEAYTGSGKTANHLAQIAQPAIDERTPAAARRGRKRSDNPEPHAE